MSVSSVTARQPGSGDQVGGGQLVLHQLRYDLVVIWRDPRSRFFTILLPVIFMVLLTSLFGNHTIRVGAQQIKASTYYVPGISVLGIMSASFVSLVMSITAQRESGVLKRRRSAPVPAWVLIASRALASVIVSVVLVVIIVVIGRVLYSVHLPSSTLPAFVIGVAVGAVSLCCLSFAVSTFIPSEDSAQPIIQAIVLPLYFISGVFVPKDQLSKTLQHIGNVFPISHLNNALFKAFDPGTTGTGISGSDLLILAAWGAAGLIIALRRFSWAPQSE
jgi:ABC-2 type transport system permease protein